MPLSTRALGASFALGLLSFTLVVAGRAAEDPLDAAVRRLASPIPAERESAAAALFSAGKAGLLALDRAESDLARDDGGLPVELRLAIRRLRLRIPVPRELIRVPAGPFLFGEPPGEEIALPEFLIDRTEVTNSQYKEFLDATGYPHLPRGTRRDDPGWDPVRRTFREGTANYPVAGVSYDDANAYATWAGLRLPTEAEWEKACRGSDGRVFPWGNEADAARGRFAAGSPAPVGSHPADSSPFGVLDMAGNVNEWTKPASPGALDYGVQKGGTYELGPNDLRLARADGYYRTGRDVRAARTGFRCARNP